MPEYDSVERHAINPFREARKEEQKLRLALDGPSGSGKTFTALIAATVLADHVRALEPESPGIAVIDTERGSAALYADQFVFDHVAMEPPYAPEKYISLIRAAEEYGYAVIVIDSLSHGWFAEGGVLDIVDNAASRRGGNRFAGWTEGTPAQNALITAIIGSKAHVIVTLRTKQEWVIDETSDGKTRPRRVGTAPVQREGIEYEFTIVSELDLEHKLMVTKSRAAALADRMVIKPGPKFFGEVVDWLKDGTRMATPEHVEQIAALSDSLTNPERTVVNGWFKEQRYRMKALSADEAETVIARMRDVIAERPETTPEPEVGEEPFALTDVVEPPEGEPESPAAPPEPADGTSKQTAEEKVAALKEALDRVDAKDGESGDTDDQPESSEKPGRGRAAKGILTRRT